MRCDIELSLNDLIEDINYESALERLNVKFHNNLYWNVLDKEAIRFYEPKTNNALLIRIDDEDLKYPTQYLLHGDKYKSILVIQFGDLTESINSNDNKDRLFNKELLKEILSEVNKGYDEIIVHCNAGISRSSAVMLGIAKYLKKDDIANYIKTIGFYYPNSFILKIFKEYLNNDMG